MEKPLVGENRLLRSLPARDLAALQPHLKKVELARGHVLHQPRDPIEHVYFPLSGMVSLLVIMRSGEAIETGVVGREGVVGGSVATGPGEAFGQAIVQIAGRALEIHARPFREAVRDSAALRALVDRYQGLILLQSQQTAACQALHCVEARLCRWLLQAHDMVESHVVELTQESLANMLGVQRTSVTLSAHALQEAGVVEYARGRITIRNRAALEDCACECYGVIRAEIDRAIPPAATPHSHFRVV
jgi:CRP-like cAMP-binding protein